MKFVYDAYLIVYFSYVLCPIMMRYLYKNIPFDNELATIIKVKELLIDTV